MPQTSVTFVSQASVATGTIKSYNLRKRIEVVKNCRNIGKKDMKFNDVMPKMRVDPESYVSALVPFMGNWVVGVLPGNLQRNLY